MNNFLYFQNIINDFDYIDRVLVLDDNRDH